MDFKDYYKILGVDKSASTEEIKKAYRTLAKKYHPDKNSGDKSAEERFKEISEAYDVIGTPEKRKKYDDLQNNYNFYQRRGGNTDDFFRSYGGGQSGQQFSGSFYDLFNNMGGFSDIFSSFMGGNAQNTSTNYRNRRTAGKKGKDVEIELHLTLEELINGVEKHISTGNKKLRVKIFPGMEEGKKLKIRSEGSAGLNGGERGDLFLKIKLIPHPIFERKENDLYTELKVDAFTAILGGKKLIKTIDGKLVNVTIPEETDSGAKLRIKGLGVKKYNSEERGDLYVIVSITSPKNLSKKEKEELKKLVKE